MGIGLAWSLFSGFFGGGKGGIVAAVLTGALLLAVTVGGGWLVANAFTIAGLERDVATEKEKTAKEREKVAVITANRDNLKAALDRQNASVSSLQESNAALSREANLRAALLLSRSQAESQTIRATPPVNVEEMNAWFRAHFQ